MKLFPRLPGRAALPPTLGLQPPPRSERPLVVLHRMCRRHGLPLEEARVLLPFLERARRPSNRDGRWMLEAAEAAVARRARELLAPRTGADAGPVPRSLSQWIP